MKVCVYGCGAIGSLLAARLAASAEVCAVARGAHLKAIQSHGLTLVSASGADEISATLFASDQPAELGEQDIVFVALKAHDLPDIAEAIQPLLGPDTIVVTVCNGIPWWYSYGLPGDAGIGRLQSIDPGGQLWERIGAERAIGCVVYPAARIVEPGVVEHVFGDRWAMGEPDGSSSDRLNALAAVTGAGGFEVELHDDIRVAIWTKLVANLAYNPVSLVTGKTLGEMIDDEATNKLLTSIMSEAIDVAQSLGISVPVTPEVLIEVTRQLGAHKTSMLQDYEAGRTLELRPLVGAVTELARKRGVATTSLDMIYGLALAKAAS